MRKKKKNIGLLESAPYEFASVPVSYCCCRSFFYTACALFVSVPGELNLFRVVISTFTGVAIGGKTSQLPSGTVCAFRCVFSENKARLSHGDTPRGKQAIWFPPINDCRRNIGGALFFCSPSENKNKLTFLGEKLPRFSKCTGSFGRVHR